MRPHRRAVRAVSGASAPELPLTDLLYGNEADVGLTLSGSDVTLWADVGLLGNDGTTTNAARRPSTTTDGTLGDCLFFDAAVGDNMEWTGASDPSNDFTIAFVLNILGTAGQKMMFYCTGGGGGGAIIVGYDGTSGDYYVNDGATTQFFGHTLTTGAQTVMFVISGTNIDLYVGRTFISSLVMNAAKAIGGTIAFGSPFVTSRTPDANLRAPYVYTVAKDGGGRTELWDYIASRHPGSGV